MIAELWETDTPDWTTFVVVQKFQYIIAASKCVQIKRWPFERTYVLAEGGSDGEELAV